MIRLRRVHIRGAEVAVGLTPVGLTKGGSDSYWSARLSLFSEAQGGGASLAIMGLLGSQLRSRVSMRLCSRRQPAAPTSVHPGVGAGVKACHHRPRPPPPPSSPPCSDGGENMGSQSLSWVRSRDGSQSLDAPARAGWTAWPHLTACQGGPEPQLWPRAAKPAVLPILRRRCC